MNEIIIRPMLAEDIEDVLAVEVLSFSTPWSQDAFESEITNKLAYYLVLEDNRQVIGYAGMWLILDEAHITNIAIIPQYRRSGLGEKLLLEMIQKAKLHGAASMTLEVRVSNNAAQCLYEKLGFEKRGIRKQYYTDTKEDALIMWAEF
ncbi:ribosomal protein S18-alanine N-acetyltransferase [Dendrosporobacter sp. 1207_IL3150]|uniref:ribosomal protein S18-alanine N-acetyltransferase n=1 Tax=Dendrosporobacter sp. 1207_IL3150 TaxID=3084054 RepID=UPI002FDB1479